MGAVGVSVLLARRLVAPLTVYLYRDKQGWSDWPPPVAPPVGAAYGRALVPWAGPSGRGRWTRWRAAPCSISLPWRRSGSASSVLTAPPGLPRCGVVQAGDGIFVRSMYGQGGCLSARPQAPGGLSRPPP